MLLDDTASILDVGGGHGQLIELYDAIGCPVTIHGSDESCFQ